MTDFLGFGYAAVVAIGGLIGYLKAGSVISLVMGLTFGAVSGLGAQHISNDPKNVWLLLVASGILTLVMGSRALNSGKFMPAGLVATLSVLTVIRLLVRLL